MMLHFYILKILFLVDNNYIQLILLLKIVKHHNKYIKIKLNKTDFKKTKIYFQKNKEKNLFPYSFPIINVPPQPY